MEKHPIFQMQPGLCFSRFIDVLYSLRKQDVTGLGLNPKTTISENGINIRFREPR